MIKPMVVDETYYDTKNQVIKAERRMLKELGFCIHVKHPHKVCCFIHLYIYILFIFNLKKSTYHIGIFYKK